MPLDRFDERLKWIRIAACTAIAGALVGMVGDYFLLYTPGGRYLEGDYSFFEGISEGRMIVGHYLGVFAIPLEAAGFYLIWLGLLPVGRKIAFGAVCAGLYVMFWGIAYHTSVYPMGEAVSLGGGRMETFRPFNEPLGVAFAGMFFVLVMAMTVAIVRGKTAFPRFLAAFSPIVTYGLVVALYHLLPTVGNLLAPMGFNLSMAIFYAAIVLTARKWGMVLPSPSA